MISGDTAHIALLHLCDKAKIRAIISLLSALYMFAASWHHCKEPGPALRTRYPLVRAESSVLREGGWGKAIS